MKRLLRYLTLCSIATYGCVGPLPEPTAAQRARPECSSTASEDYFFPNGALSTTDAYEQLERPMPSRLLASIQAPSLSCGRAQSREVYRLVGRTVHMGVPPLIVSVALDDSMWLLRAVQLRNHMDLTATIDNSRMLSSQEAQAMAQAIRESRFWTTPGLRQDSRDIVDGSTWILEGRRDTAYHVVRRRPVPEDPVRALAVTMARLAKLPPSPSLNDLLSTLRESR